MGLILVVSAIAPQDTFGEIRYSIAYVGEVTSEAVDSLMVRPQEDRQTIFSHGGRVYETQYVPPPASSGPSDRAAQDRPVQDRTTQDQPIQGGVLSSGQPPRQSLPTIVPYITVSERYDSNVFFTPKKVYDYVTNVTPGARWNFQNSYIDGTLTGAMIAERYALNPGLSYIGTSGGLSAGLDNLFGHLAKGWSVRLSDSFVYTPQQAAFVAPEGGNQVSSAFLRGIQAYRNNSLSNVGSVTSRYPISPDTTLAATYTHQILRFYGKSDPTITGSLFDVTGQTFSAGPEYQLTPSDTILVTYQYQNLDFAPQGSGNSQNATTQGGMLTWRGRLTPLINVEAGAGGAVVFPSSSFQTTFRGLLQYTTSTVQGAISYSRGVYPSYFLSGGPIVGDVAAATVTYNLTREWFVVGGYNYSNNRSVQSGLASFESHSPTGSVNYRINPILTASGSVTYYQLRYSTNQSTSNFAREVFMLSIRAEWN